MKKLIMSVGTRVLALGIAVSVLFGAITVGGGTTYATHTPYLSLTAASVAAITVPGTVPGPYNLGTYVSGGDGGGTSPPNAWAFSGGSFNPPSANALDYNWMHFTFTPVIWDLGAPRGSALVFPSIDHAPGSYEGVEVTVWGSNNSGAVFPGGWTQATLATVYADGWVDVGAPQESDDYASLWTFGSNTFQYVALYANGSLEYTPDATDYDDCPSEPVWCSGEAEIDAVGYPKSPIVTPTSPPPSLGGTAEYPGLSSGSNAGLLAGVFGAGMVLVVLSGAAWYARRRLDN